MEYFSKIYLIYNQKKHFFFGYCFYFAFAIIMIFVFGNQQFSQFVNAIYHPFLDNFFYWITYFGDGLFAVLFFLIVFFIRIDYGFISLISFLIPGMITQVLKRVCFPNIPRPSVVFKELINSGEWHLVDGLDLHSYFSFPSGHTTTVFSLCCISILLIKNKFFQIPFLLTAILTGFSRIYLSQHFLLDVLIGSIIGCFGSALVYITLFNKINSYKFSLLNWITNK